MDNPQILLTNDDGIRSPGLWAAAKALSEIGFVHVVAPRDQFSGAGRSLPTSTDGLIRLEQVQVNGMLWDVHAVGGSPAQAVLHGVFEVLPVRPDLVVSGINYGENVGSGVTISGTVGAALQGASLGIPALAISLEMDVYHHLSYSTDVDFTVAAHFAVSFARILLERRLPPDVDVLKVDVPCNAAPDTPWELTRVSRNPYFIPLKPARSNWDVPSQMDYKVLDTLEGEPEDTDISALRSRRHVAVAPLSLDLTSRVDFWELKKALV